ncbi:thiamine pyrophosphokinase [Nocardioides anomalus]|uniref:Thiamine pyrophosphokinase n=1 Tax=Nocardioides anomalus TaxID=2712223 RepID=A0A6G6WDU2_9ACTN|nr:putative cytokinetic ring protein SteA [Nocardioides anomalus]QIG43412.1 thiamine pyrophosphokinase [Nocardioides anomalus]
MKANARRTTLTASGGTGPGGVLGTARVGVDPASLLPSLQPGDVAVLDHADLDRQTATALVDAGVVAVVNAQRMGSGRYASLGPEVLAEAALPVVDQIGAEGLSNILDAQQVRVHQGVVYAVRPDGGVDELAVGRDVDLDLVHRDTERAQSAARGPVDLLAPDPGEALEQEWRLLLQGQGLPHVRTALRDRPVVVVARADHADLQAVASFVREQAPVVVAVGRAADDLIGLTWAPDIVLVTAGDPDTVPSGDALRVATDVVLMTPPGSGLDEQATIETVATNAPLLVDSTASAEDVALLLAEHHGASVVVGVGLHARLEDYLDRPGEAPTSGFVTRLKLGERLVTPTAVRALYSGRPGSGQLAFVVVAGLLALLAAIAVTPVGRDWVQSVVDQLQGLT